MSKAYLSAQVPVFGIVGIAHIEGIQHNLIKALGHSMTYEKFSFFYINFDLENRKVDAWHGRNSMYKLPINVTVIDATKKSNAAWITLYFIQAEFDL